MGFDNHKQEVYNLVQALKALFLYSQLEKKIVDEYEWNFKSFWDMVEAFRGFLGLHRSTVEAFMKDSTKFVDPSRPTDKES